MLSLIGLIVLWPVVTMAMAWIINSLRAKLGIDINDGVSQMLIGFVWGPIGIVLSLMPFHIHRFIGGMAGTYWAYQIYQRL